MKNHSKFLEFNGNKILFLSVDGTYWIALKPILDALGMDADRSLKRVKKDPILGSERSIQTVQVPNSTGKQGRKMVCLPECFIYGWIFSLRSDSEELTKFKKTCYKLLYNHFHGTITNRKELLLERKDVDTQIHQVNERLKLQGEDFKLLEHLKKEKKQLNSKLNHIDKELIKEPELFNN